MANILIEEFPKLKDCIEYFVKTYKGTFARDDNGKIFTTKSMFPVDFWNHIRYAYDQQ